MEVFSFLVNNPIFENFILWVRRLWFLWVPFFLGYLAWHAWLSQVRAKYVRNLDWVLLEIKVPRQVAKTPRAMETVLASLYSTYAGTRRNRWLDGFLPAWYSLELASINGQIHFFIYTQKFFRKMVESQFYAQHPDIEIVEVDDYTYAADVENLEEWNLWGMELGLSKADAYPIRTYVDFGLHETLVEEEKKVDPLVSFLEYLGSLKEGEQVWFQVLIKGASKGWVEEGKRIIDEMLGRGGEDEKEKRLSKGEQDVLAALERSISKPGFETGIRVLYCARRDIFNFVNVASILGVVNQYNSYNLNGFRPLRSTAAGFLFRSRRETRKKKIMLDAYRKRSYFYAPYRRRPFVFNTEELATIYHFPGRVAETPTFSRIETRKGEPPATLPV
jgi:hypothetical protein